MCMFVCVWVGVGEWRERESWKVEGWEGKRNGKESEEGKERCGDCLECIHTDICRKQELPCVIQHKL